MQLHSAQTAFLKERFARGELDVILTTEAEARPRRRDAGQRAAGLDRGAGREGVAASARCRSAPSSGCIFNRAAIETLNAAGFDWKLEVDSASNPVMDASIAADIVVRLHMLSTVPAQFEVIPHHGALPRLPAFCINMYLTPGPRRRLAEPLAQQLRAAYSDAGVMAAE